MRRIKTKEIDKSKEKEKRDILVQSIAVEQSVKTSLDSQNKELKKTIDALKKEVLKCEDDVAKSRENKKKFQDAEVKFSEKARSAEAKTIELESKIEELNSTIEELKASISGLRNAYVNEQAIMVSVRDKENEEHARHITNLQSQISNMESRVATLIRLESDITQSIHDKKLEQTGLEHTLQFRLQELSRVNVVVDSTKSEYERTKEEYEIWGRRLDEIKTRFNKVDKEVENKTLEVKKKEQEVENMREQLVALMSREKKIDEKASVIRDLFERAGLNVKI